MSVIGELRVNLVQFKVNYFLKRITKNYPEWWKAIV